MFEKKLYALCVLLSLSWNAYAMIGEDEFSSSPSRSNPGPSSSGISPDQETDKTKVRSSSRGTLTFKWLDLEKAAGGTSKKDRQARILHAYFDYLREVFFDRERDQRIWKRRDLNRFYTIPISKEDLDAPEGSLVNPLWEKYGKDTDVAIKIATIIGLIPTTKEVITEVGSVLVSPQKLRPTSKRHRNHKQREVELKELAREAARRLKEERVKRQRLQASLEDEIKKNEALLSELENLKDKCQRLQSDFEGVADFFVFNFQR